jgi:hypothetical protein
MQKHARAGPSNDRIGIMLDKNQQLKNNVSSNRAGDIRRRIPKQGIRWSK